MQTERHFPVTLLALGALTLGGCSAFENLGGGKKVSPDEFKIVSHSPLTMPPNAELRPPRPGEPRPQEDLDRPTRHVRPCRRTLPAARSVVRVPRKRASDRGRRLGTGAGRQGGPGRDRSQHSQPREYRHADDQRQRQELRRLADLLAGHAAVGRRDRSGQGAAEAARRPGRPASLRPRPTATITRRKRGLLEGIF